MSLNLVHCNQIRNTKQVSFGSKNHPIEPFVIKTKKGPLFVEELSENDIPKAAKFEMDFYEKEFPIWGVSTKNKSKAEIKRFLSYLAIRQKSVLSNKEGNGTVLVAKNFWGQVKALFQVEHFCALQSFMGKDEKTAHVETCFIDGKYRSQGIGKILFEKLLETTKGRFTDIYLEAENKAVSFYKRAGFEPLDTSNPALKKISDCVLTHRPDRDEITLMSKTLDPANPWWKRVAKQLEHIK